MSDRARQELNRLSKTGKLDARKVVDFARDPSTALHAKFTWDDGDAAEHWRLHEARNLIRVYAVRELSKDEPDLEHVFVSLREDRNAKNGYRCLASVISNAELRAKLLEDALEDARYFRTKYRTLSELKPILSAIDAVERERSAKPAVRKKAA